MTLEPLPPFVAKVAAFLRSATPHERAELDAWLIRAERQVETIKAAVRALAAVEIAESVADVPGFRPVAPPPGPPELPAGLVDLPNEPGTSRQYRGALHIARCLAESGRPLSVADLVTQTGSNTTSVIETLACSWFDRAKQPRRDGQRGRQTYLYYLSAAGRAALARDAAPAPVRTA